MIKMINDYLLFRIIEYIFKKNKDNYYQLPLSLQKIEFLIIVLFNIHIFSSY